MANIGEIISGTDPENLGLIPYMSMSLGEDFDRFQLRPHDFASKAFATGCRIRRGSRKKAGGSRSKRTTTRMVMVAWEIRLDEAQADQGTTDQLSLPVAAAMLGDILCFYIEEWYDCINSDALGQLPDLSMNDVVGPTQDKKMNSANPMAWYCTAIVMFPLTYIPSPPTGFQFTPT